MCQCSHFALYALQFGGANHRMAHGGVPLIHLNRTYRDRHLGMPDGSKGDKRVKQSLARSDSRIKKRGRHRLQPGVCGCREIHFTPPLTEIVSLSNPSRQGGSNTWIAET